MAVGVRFGRKPKLSEYQRAEALKRTANGETLAAIAKNVWHGDFDDFKGVATKRKTGP
jgi:hypothetical protein